MQKTSAIPLNTSIAVLVVAFLTLFVPSGVASNVAKVVPKKVAASSQSTQEVHLSDDKAWVLKLRTAAIGMIICHISKNAFLAESAVGYILADRKTNGCTIYNPVKKLYMTYTEDMIKKRFVIQNRQGQVYKKAGQSLGWDYQPPKFVGKETLQGLHTKVYEQKNLFKMSYTDKWVVSRTWYLDQMNFDQMPEGAAMIVSRISRTREVDRRVALKETIHTFVAKKDGKIIDDSPVKEELSLVSLKTEPFNPKLFEIPKGYAVCTSEVTLFALDGVDGHRSW